MKTTTIDASLLPKMWLTWSTTKGTFYLDCTTGKKQIEAPENVGYRKPERLINSGSKPRFGYAKYHEDLEMLELAEVTIETTRKEEPKAWKYAGEKYFLKKDKTVLDENGNIKTNIFILSQYHDSRDFKGFLGMFYRIEIPTNISEFKKFIGSDTYTVGSGRVVEIKYAWHIQEWYKTKQKTKGAGKQQKLTDKLTTMEIEDINAIAKKHSKKCTIQNSWSGNGMIYFERLSDGWSVLRIINILSDNTCTEVERMYLHDDGTNRIVSPSQGSWVPARQTHTYRNYTFVNKDEAMSKCMRLKYILPSVEAESTQSLRNSLITILRFPEVEQMISLGYRRAANHIAHSTTPKSDLKFMFGGCYNEKETALLRKACMTKHQLDTYMKAYNTGDYYSKPSRALAEMRKMFGDKLIHLDNNTFDEYLTGFIAMDRGYGREPFDYLKYIDGVNREKFLKNALRLGKKNPNVYTMLDDTLRQWQALNRGTHPAIDWYFDSYSDVVRAHDAIDELKRAQDAERRAIWDRTYAERLKREEKKRLEVDKERKQYEYEDVDYMIRLPKDSNEIVREGSMQRICIGGYTSRHALGQTNLFFLRRKSNPDAPFYAIEMNNNNVIVQIHGYCNSWLGNNPEAIPTVVRWLRKNGIKCDQKILTCKAKGYGATNDHVPMPVVD